MEDRQRRADPPLERGLGRVRALGDGEASVRGAPAESAQGRDHVGVELGLRAPLLHERGAKGPVGLVLIVGRAEQPDGRRRRSPAARERDDVIELEEAALAAAFTLLADKRALRTITRVHRALDVVGNASGTARVDAFLRGARRLGRRELLPLQGVEQRVQRVLDHLAEITGGHPVAQQPLARPCLFRVDVGFVSSEHFSSSVRNPNGVMVNEGE